MGTAPRSFQTFRRVADVERSRKGGLQQPPKTLDVSKRMSANKKKKKEVAEATLSTHHNNVVNMYRCSAAAHPTPHPAARRRCSAGPRPVAERLKAGARRTES